MLGSNGIIIIIGVASLILMIVTLLLFIMSYRTYKGMICENKMRLNALEQKHIEPNVVVIGGGTGQSVFLRGLKSKTKNISAVVTVADDGGGSGALREDLGMLPPGDIRNCLLALANIEPTMSEVMQYRFKEGALKGQSFGNLFLAAMNGLYDNFETATYKMGEVFAITGRVMPVTLDDINLVAELENGEQITGESEIPKACSKMNTKIKSISLDKKNAKPLADVLSAIELADIIVLGPGSLYTSVIPNLLVEGVCDALKKSNAPKVYITNIMTQPGETDGYNVVEHIKAMIKVAGENFFDYVLVNNEKLPEEVVQKYEKDGSSQVHFDKAQEKVLNDLGITCIHKNLLQVKSGYVRHDSKRLADIVVKLAVKHSYTFTDSDDCNIC